MGKSLIRSAAAVSVLLMASALSHAAGLGKLTVISTLGQPFRAEIDLVSVKKEELASLNAKLAAPDAFKQADLPYTSYVSNMKLALEKRPNGDPYIKVTSFQPLNEPFVDFLVELSWQSGRLVRAYTALVDPPVVSDAQEGKTPEVKGAPVESAPGAVAAAPAEPNMAVEPKPAESSAAVNPPVVTESAAAAPVVPEATATASKPEMSAPAAQPAPAPQPTEKPTPPETAMAPIDVMVKRGDTLAKIARAAKPEDVTLEQMLVLLYRNNPEAFAGKNMNRLKAGKVLRLPESSQYESVAAPEAKKIVRIQAANWRAYREKLAAAVGASTTSDTTSDASASGKVTTTIEEKNAGAAEAPKEVLKLSKGESGKTAAVGTKAAKGKAKVETLEEEAAAKGKAAKDSGERVAQLEQNLKNMQDLLELKNKGMSETQKSAATPPAETKPAEVVPPAAEVKPAETTAQTTEPAKPVEAAPAPVKKPKFVPPPPPPEPSFMDRLMDPTILGGIGLLAIAGLVGGFFWKRRRATAAGATEVVAKDVDLDGSGAEAPVMPSSAPVIPLAVAAAKGLPGETHEEGDPLAEAEIFLTYGRDTLAEDRLKEAIAANPKRHELHLKLLEIYAGRKDANAFEQVAKELQVATSGKGEIWNRAARMGYEIDPSNSRYAAGRPSEEDEGVKTVVAGAGGLIAAAAAAAAAAPAKADQTKTSLDFNLGMGEHNDIGTTTDIDLSRLGREVQESAGRTDIDLSDLTGIADATTESVILDPGQKMPEALTATNTGMKSKGAMATHGADLDFDFDVTSLTASTTGGASASPANDGGLNFDLGALDLDLPASGKPAMPPPVGGMPELDLSGINLDLGGASGLGGSAKDDKWYDVQTKFDLAKAYQEMGDKDGAREILQEVIAEGDDDQKAAATAVLSSLV